MRPAKAPGTAALRADAPRTIAVVPAGYADGLDRRMAGRAFMLVRGKRVPVVGSVCMDMTMIDVTGMDVSTGDEVVIVGEQGSEQSACARSPLDRHDSVRALCRVGTRIERQFSA
jgi:alanine racemase